MTKIQCQRQSQKKGMPYQGNFFDKFVILFLNGFVVKIKILNKCRSYSKGKGISEASANTMKSGKATALAKAKRKLFYFKTNN